MQIDVERFCVFKVKVGGHRASKCPQCKALQLLAIEVNNGTLDQIADLMVKVAEKDGAVLNPQKAVDTILGLKTV